MARHQLTGTEFCPLPACYSLSLGRYRTKNVRNRANSMYAERFYFRHNDKTIPEHYVDNYVRKKEKLDLDSHPFGKFILSARETIHELKRASHTMHKAIEQMNAFPLTPEEIKKLTTGIDHQTEIMKGFIKMAALVKLLTTLRLSGKELPKWLQKEEQRLVDLFYQLNQREQEIDKLINENPSLAVQMAIENLKKDPLNIAIQDISKKYIFPERRKKRTDINKKLSEGDLNASRFKNYHLEP